ncbi:hypothetical protein JCM8208_003984 [Rhodotorula glutinis]
MPEPNAFFAYTIAGPFAFLDLVALRKRKGTLIATSSQGTSRSVIEQVPHEIWGIVRHKVVDLELREAEIEHVKEYKCTYFVDQGLELRNMSWNDTVAACWGYTPENHTEDGRVTKRYLGVACLLWYFGLAQPCFAPLSAYSPSEQPFENYVDCDPNTATIVAIPEPTKPVYVALERSARADGDDRAISRDLPPIPPDAVQRFHRLVSTMHLQPVNTRKIITSEFILCRPGRSPTESVGEKREFDKVRLEDMAPRWTLAPLWTAGA